MNKIDIESRKELLSELGEEIKCIDHSVESYLANLADHEVLNPVRASFLQPMVADELIPPEFFEGFGIQRITLNASHGRLSISDEHFIKIVKDKMVKYRWHEFQNQSIIEDLKDLFRNACIIEFSDWSNVLDASDIWDNLRRDVIQPLNKKDFDFIFDLGDPTKRSMSDVSEVLDIISDFSLYGRVILLLDAADAVQLWAGFNGLNTARTSTDFGPAILSEVYRYLFDTIRMQHSMHAHQLLICSADGVTLFSKQQKIELAAATLPHARASGNARNHFIGGYSLGVLLKLEIPLCILLAMVVSGVYIENKISPDVGALLSYTEKWIKSLELFLPQKKLEGALY